MYVFLFLESLTYSIGLFIYYATKTTTILITTILLGIIMSGRLRTLAYFSTLLGHLITHVNFRINFW